MKSRLFATLLAGAFAAPAGATPLPGTSLLLNGAPAAATSVTMLSGLTVDAPYMLSFTVNGDAWMGPLTGLMVTIDGARLADVSRRPLPDGRDLVTVGFTSALDVSRLQFVQRDAALGAAAAIGDITVSAVPEPGSAGLLVVALLALQASSSFLKKRTKKLSSSWLGGAETPPRNGQKFWLLFPKRSASFPN